MKRRSTKKALHSTEIIFLDSLRLYLDRPRGEEAQKSEEFSRDIVALSLSMLLSFHLQLNPFWPINERWINKLTLFDIAIKEPVVFVGHGELLWSEMNGKIEISKTDEFAFKVSLRERGRNRLEYEITFGHGDNKRTIKNLSKSAV